jgi:signal transduction histidine kinase
MKPKFAYLYISFIISLALLVILSFLFYKRINAHLKYSRQFDNSYGIILQLNQLQERMIEMENYSRGYLLISDSSFLPLFNSTKKSIPANLDSLQKLLKNNKDQLSRFRLMKSTISTQLNIYSHIIERAYLEDKKSERLSIMRGKMLMDTFLLEAKQIENTEINQKNELYQTKEFFEDIYPGYFNTLSIWAGVITLVSFFFINREVRMRSRYQAELEKKLLELNQTNSELQQFAHIASHDLQEPLRKIRTFTDKLVYRYRDGLNEESKHVVDRIEVSAQRMQELIQDMSNFTSLISDDKKMADVDLNVVVTKVLKDFLDQSRKKHAIITWDNLPLLKGNETQLSLLFKSLFDNSFKFSKPGESPVIKISYRLVDGTGEADEHLKGRSYHKIVMEDNGIGFSNEFAEKIFMIFKRLHTQQSGYRGKGIGLAIAQRIMTNHNGVIMARGMVNDGATFIMYFPV